MNYKKLIPVLLAGVMVLSACSQNAAQTNAAVEETYTAIESYTVSLGDIRKEMVYAGQVAPSESVNVMSKMAGKVQEVYFDVGDVVNEGDVLFKLDEKDVQDTINTLSAQVNQASRTVDTARNSLNTVTGGQYQAEINRLENSIDTLDKQIESSALNLSNAQIALDNAKAALDLADISFENTKTLYEAEAISKIAYDQAVLEHTKAETAYQQAINSYDTAKLALDTAQSNKEQTEETLSLTTGQITDDNIRQAQLSVNSAVSAQNIAQVQLRIARDTLNDTTITSPMAGTISSKTVKPNEFTSTAIAAFTIVDVENVNIDVKVSEVLINTIYPGLEVEVIIKSLQDEPLKGKVKTVSPAADQTSTFPVTIELENRDGLIKPGMFAEVKFIKEESRNTVVLPRNAVLEDEINSFVYVVEGNAAKKVVVETGIDNGNQIEITKGISQQDQVIVKGQTYVYDGEKVNDVTSGEE